MGDAELDDKGPEFKVDKTQEVAKGTVGDGVIDADEAKQAAEESLAAMEKHKQKLAEEKEEVRKRELVRAATKGGLGGLAAAIAKPKKEEAQDKAGHASKASGSAWHSWCWHHGECVGCLQGGAHAGAARAETCRTRGTGTAVR